MRQILWQNQGTSKLFQLQRGWVMRNIMYQSPLALKCCHQLQPRMCPPYPHQDPQGFSPPLMYSATHPPDTSKYTSVSKWDSNRSQVPMKEVNFCWHDWCCGMLLHYSQVENIYHNLLQGMSVVLWVKDKTVHTPATSDALSSLMLQVKCVPIPCCCISPTVIGTYVPSVHW